MPTPEEVLEEAEERLAEIDNRLDEIRKELGDNARLVDEIINLHNRRVDLVSAASKFRATLR